MKPCRISELIIELNKIDGIGEYVNYNNDGVDILSTYPFCHPSIETTDETYTYIHAGKGGWFIGKQNGKGNHRYHYKNYNSTTELATALMRRVRRMCYVKGIF